MGQAFAEQSFDSYEDVEKLWKEWFTAKEEDFYWHDIYKLPEKWEKCITNYGAYLDYSTFYHSYKFNLFFVNFPSSLRMSLETDIPIQYCKNKIRLFQEISDLTKVKFSTNKVANSDSTLLSSLLMVEI